VDRVQNPIADPAALSPTAPGLDAFVSAAAAGRLLWARWAQGQLEICCGPTPSSPPSPEIGRLFVAAMREHFGEAASAIAEREWRLNLQSRRLLPARTVRRAVACAESARSLLMAQSYLLQIEFSAAMLGWRFRRVAESLGLDPNALSMERRRALDQLLAPDFAVAESAGADAVGQRLKTLLLQVVH
jgi:hypothetical protein